MRALSALTALTLLAGCTAPQQPTTATTETAQPTPSTVFDPPTGPPSNVVTFPTPPTPDAGTRAAYLADLNLIDPDIVHDDPDQAVQRGVDQCATLQQFPGDLDRQIGIAHERFTSPNHPRGFPLGDTKYIVQTVHKYLCPDYPYPSVPAGPSPAETGDRGQ